MILLFEDSTVFNVSTQIRNVVGNAFQMASNGHFGIGKGKTFKNAGLAAMDDLFKTTTNKEVLEFG